MQSSDYGWLNIRMGGEFYFLFQIEILKLTCLGVPREGEREKRKSERAFGEDSQPTAQNMTSNCPTLEIMEG